uniref:Reverse transcriptase n=1 Tax=Johansenicoccus eremophilus TaxID=3068301 RepID=A0AA49LMT7_9CHLO|nr:putative reverse transcriptase [Chlorophyceae sp. KF-2023a]
MFNQKIAFKQEPKVTIRVFSFFSKPRQKYKKKYYLPCRSCPQGGQSDSKRPLPFLTFNLKSPYTLNKNGQINESLERTSQRKNILLFGLSLPANQNNKIWQKSRINKEHIKKKELNSSELIFALRCYKTKLNFYKGKCLFSLTFLSLLPKVTTKITFFCSVTTQVTKNDEAIVGNLAAGHPKVQAKLIEQQLSGLKLKQNKEVENATFFYSIDHLSIQNPWKIKWMDGMLQCSNAPIIKRSINYKTKPEFKRMRKAVTHIQNLYKHFSLFTLRGTLNYTKKKSLDFFQTQTLKILLTLNFFQTNHFLFKQNVNSFKFFKLNLFYRKCKEISLSKLTKKEFQVHGEFFNFFSYYCPSLLPFAVPVQKINMAEATFDKTYKYRVYFVPPAIKKLKNKPIFFYPLSYKWICLINKTILVSLAFLNFNTVKFTSFLPSRLFEQSSSPTIAPSPSFALSPKVTKQFCSRKIKTKKVTHFLYDSAFVSFLPVFTLTSCRFCPRPPMVAWPFAIATLAVAKATEAIGQDSKRARTFPVATLAVTQELGYCESNRKAAMLFFNFALAKSYSRKGVIILNLKQKPGTAITASLSQQKQKKIAKIAIPNHRRVAMTVKNIQNKSIITGSTFEVIPKEALIKYLYGASFYFYLITNLNKYHQNLLEILWFHSKKQKPFFLFFAYRFKLLARKSIFLFSPTTVDVLLAMANFSYLFLNLNLTTIWFVQQTLKNWLLSSFLELPTFDYTTLAPFCPSFLPFEMALRPITTSTNVPFVPFPVAMSQLKSPLGSPKVTEQFCYRKIKRKKVIYYPKFILNQTQKESKKNRDKTKNKKIRAIWFESLGYSVSSLLSGFLQKLNINNQVCIQKFFFNFAGLSIHKYNTSPQLLSYKSLEFYHYSLYSGSFDPLAIIPFYYPTDGTYKSSRDALEHWSIPSMEYSIFSLLPTATNGSLAFPVATLAVTQELGYCDFCCPFAVAKATGKSDRSNRTGQQKAKAKNLGWTKVKTKKNRSLYVPFTGRNNYNNLPFFLHLKGFYQSGKVFVLPSRSSVQNHCSVLKNILKRSKTDTPMSIIQKLSPKIISWSTYYSQFHSFSRIFTYLDYFTFRFLWRWACRRHPKKSRQWIKQKYFLNLSTLKKYEQIVLLYSPTLLIFAAQTKNGKDYFCLPSHKNYLLSDL